MINRTDNSFALHEKTDGEYLRARIEKLQSRLRELSLKRVRTGKGDIERRLGAILICNIKHPWRWPLIPLQMFRAVKYHRQLTGGSFSDKDKYRANMLFDRARSVGIQAAIEELDAGLVGTPLAELLTRASESAFIAGRPDLELDFAERALRTAESWRILGRLVSARMDLGDIAGAYGAFEDLDSLSSRVGGQGCKAAIAQWRRTSLVELKVLQQLKPRGAVASEYVVGRVCYVLHAALPVTSNGYATRSHAVACSLVENGWDVHPLLRPGYPWDVVDGVSSVSPTVEVDGLSYRYSKTDVSKKHDVVGYLLESADILTEQMRVLKPALVIAASNYHVALMSLIACRRLGIPLIYEQRGRWEITRQSRDPDFYYDAGFQVQYYMEGLLAREADAVWTLTTGLRDLLIEQGVDRRRIQLLPNGASANQFKPRPRDLALSQELGIPAGIPVLGYIGSFVDYEGLDDLLEAAILLKARGCVFRLLLVGNEAPSGGRRSGLTAALKERAIVGGLRDWVIMPGRVPHEDVVAYYSLVDIAPFPRKDLPVCELVSPLKPLEAMAMGKLVVVSSVQALADICGWGERGIVVDKGSPSALSEGLFDALVELKSPSGIAERGAAFVREERGWKSMVEKLQPGMRRLIEKRI